MVHGKTFLTQVYADQHHSILCTGNEYLAKFWLMCPESDSERKFLDNLH